MKLADLKQKISEYQYFEDSSIIDAALAAIIATRMKYGENIWFVIIGPSSGGKSQILRPLAMTDEKFIHRIDDLTENTFMSGANIGKGKGEPSLLLRIGERGIIVISDLTMLFSKQKEAKTAILGQFRGIYDGEVTKYTGTSSKPIKWQGSLGVLAGSTPSIYRHFEEVADMGERFIYWRMRDYDGEKATRLAMGRGEYGRELDKKLAGFYAEYLKEVVVASNGVDIVLDAETTERIIKISMLAELVRTTAHTDWHGTMDEMPVSAMPIRVSLQLTAIAKGLLAMRKYESGGGAVLGEGDWAIIEHCGFSLANDKKRACLRVLSRGEFGTGVRTQTVADSVGLGTDIVGVVLQNLASVGLLDRGADGGGLTWTLKRQSDWEIVRRVEGLTGGHVLSQRELTTEENIQSGLLADEIISKM